MRALLLVLAGLLVSGASISAAAGTRLLDESVDESYPHVTVVDSLIRPLGFRVELSSVPRLPLSEDSRIELECQKGGRLREHDISLQGRLSPVRVKLEPLFEHRTAECFVEATARYEDPDADGTMTMRLYGEAKPKFNKPRTRERRR
jgi:hypothetical protein